MGHTLLRPKFIIDLGCCTVSDLASRPNPKSPQASTEQLLSSLTTLFANSHSVVGNHGAFPTDRCTAK